MPGESYPNPRDCEHGRQRGKCADCECASLSAENERLREACEAALAYIPNSEVRSWPPGWRLKDEALAKLKAVLSPVTP